MISANNYLNLGVGLEFKLRNFRMYNRLAVLLITLMAFSGSASAGLLFNFSDNGSGTTLLTASGSLDLTGSTAATGVHSQLIGWDDDVVGNTGLVADSDLFLFNNPGPSINSNFHQYNSVGPNTLSVGGNYLAQTSSLWMDGNQPDNYQFFALNFGTALAQTGIVVATGSAVLDFDFANLPYASGTSLDLMQDQSVVFDFGASASVPEPSILALMGLGLAGIGFARRRRQS